MTIMPNREYFSKVMEKIISHDFTPKSEYALTLYGFPIHGYPVPKNSAYTPKTIISDMDGVWNDKQIFGCYLQVLCRLNKKLKRQKEVIFKNLKELSPENVDEPVGNIENVYIESRVTYNQHIISCIFSSKMVGLKTNSIDCLSELRRMYYNIEFFSGSPDMAVKAFVNNRMSIVGLGWENARGSKYIPDKDGFICKIEPLLYRYKKDVVEERLKDTVGTTKGINFVVSDEAGDMHMIQSFINPFIITGDCTEQPSDVTIRLPEARNDMTKIIPAIRKAEMGLCFTLGYTMREQEMILKSAYSLETSSRNAIESKCTSLLKRNEVLKHFAEYKSLTEELIAYSNCFTELESLERKLKDSKTCEKIKSCTSELMTELKKYSPHTDIANDMTKYF